MHLNQLYGYFGRKQELLKTVNVHVDDIKNYITQNVVKTIIEINPEYYTVLLTDNLPSDIIRDLTIRVDQDIKMIETEIKANVSIAAAVTAYARIHMIPFKNNADCLYTDTDSVFTTKPLPSHMIGTELGLMKDEMEGTLITKAYFLGIKKYGYQYTDKTGKTIDKSVFSGIKRDSLSFAEIESIFRGDTLIKETPNRFYKSFKNLNVIIKTSKTSIKMDTDKKLVGNNFIPLNITNLNHELDNRIIL